MLCLRTDPQVARAGYGIEPGMGALPPKVGDSCPLTQGVPYPRRVTRMPSPTNSQGRHFFLTFPLTFLAGRGIFYLDVGTNETLNGDESW